jgi:ABC-2 type transport system ATP-binding protein
VQVTEASELTAPMKHTDKLTEVLNALKEVEIELSTINVRQPTLDDVFFALTGNVHEGAGGS